MLNPKQAQICISRADLIIKSCKSFKIGKTGQPLLSRFNAKYRREFEQIKQLYSSKNEILISELESTLNSHYFSHPQNGNYKEGSAGDMNDYSPKYLLYIVFTPKRNLLERLIKTIRQD